MLTKTLTLTTLSLAALAAAPALAQGMSATTATNLNVRSGPGTEFRILGTTLIGEEVTVLGCIEGRQWCRIDSPDGEGWAYAPYLEADREGSMTPMSEYAGVTVIEDDAVRDDSTMMTTEVAAQAEITASPVGARTNSFVNSHPVDPVYLRGEAVVGATLPEDVELHDIPTRPDASYANINGDTVLVDRLSRRVIHVM